MPYETLFPGRLLTQGFHVLPIRHTHLYELITLPWHHRDPFDRMLIAQARIERLTIVSRDPEFPAYGVDVLW